MQMAHLTCGLICMFRWCVQCTVTLRFLNDTRRCGIFRRLSCWRVTSPFNGRFNASCMTTTLRLPRRSIGPSRPLFYCLSVMFRYHLASSGIPADISVKVHSELRPRSFLSLARRPRAAQRRASRHRLGDRCARRGTKNGLNPDFHRRGADAFGNRRSGRAASYKGQPRTGAFGQWTGEVRHACVSHRVLQFLQAVTHVG